MRIIKSAMVAASIVLSTTATHAGPFCDQFQSTSTEKQGAYILFMIDSLLRAWPQHEKNKRAMTDAERLGLFADARKKIMSECESGKDFAAGVAFGEDLAVYKMLLLDGVSGKKSPRR